MVIQIASLLKSEILADTFKLIWIFSPFKNVDDS